ncbi:MAG: DUF349 domain-containing protein, partial [Bacteroidales bacterium]|nr:DUF349 domain-containing protein [Bacteroidales bacterium]
KQWKEIGPVSRKKSEQIWKRFRAACDKFFDRRDKHFGSQEGSFSDNLNKKNALIAKIKAYEMADEQANIQALKDFQAQWAAIGFVPFKEKEKIQAEYTAALQEKFGDLVQSERAPRAKRHDNRGGRQNSKPMSEKDRLIAKFIKMEQEITTWENNMGFFSKSKNAEALLSELSAKIDAARAELAELEEKIKAQEQQEQGEE